jgi:hypothetical protein
MEVEMSLYHLHVNVGRRKNNASAKAKLDYIFREGRSKNAGARKDYIDRPDNDMYGQSEVVYSVSENMPGWAKKNPGNFWSATDKFEFKNGVLYREIEFALPVEMKPVDRHKLALTFAQEVAEVEGGRLPFSLAVHRGKEHNPHCHVIFSERVNDGIERSPTMFFKRTARGGKKPSSGGARKAQIGSKNADKYRWLKGVRELWEEMHNTFIEMLKIDAHPIDCRSYEDQRIDLTPQIHLGPILFNALMNKSEEDALRDLHEKQLARLAEYVRRDDIRAAQNAETVIEDDDAPQM